MLSRSSVSLVLDTPVEHFCPHGSDLTHLLTDGLAAPGTYNWEVSVPVNVVEGIYQLALLQGDEDPVFSPAFSLLIPVESTSSTTDAPTTAVSFPTSPGATATTTETTTITAIYIPGPSGLSPNGTTPIVTYIYWEEACGCHQTSTCDYTALPASLSTTTVAYSEEACGCTTTIEAPCAETVIPVPAPAPAVPTVAPAPAPPAPSSSTTTTTTPAPAPAPTPTGPVAVAPQATTPAAYTGAAAEKLAGSSLGFLALLAALVVA